MTSSPWARGFWRSSKRISLYLISIRLRAWVHSIIMEGNQLRLVWSYRNSWMNSLEGPGHTTLVIGISIFEHHVPFSSISAPEVMKLDLVSQVTLRIRPCCPMIPFVSITLSGAAMSSGNWTHLTWGLEESRLFCEDLFGSLWFSFMLVSFMHV
jgi:hypothetical protein